GGVGGGAQAGLVFGEARGRGVGRSERGADRERRGARGLRGEREARGEERVDEARGVAEEEPAVAGEALHRVAVVALALERAERARARHAARERGAEVRALGEEPPDVLGRLR